MRTYLVLWFNSEGRSATEVTDRLMSMGFRPVQGNYDYVYEWGKDASVDEAINMGDMVHATLRNCNAMFKLETI
ncbi:MAG: hypothetical protein JW834_04030 [Candidatus Diapherotrites archaeon]|nr:hypothetical protein [Candidatus Diapherotrites archaeon]